MRLTHVAIRKRTIVADSPCRYTFARASSKGAQEAGATMTLTAARPLRRILGLGFGLALVLGTTVGVGILRLPGTVAAALGDRTLVIADWTVGGLHALIGAVAVAELAPMIPATDGLTTTNTTAPPTATTTRPPIAPTTA